ncbi:MAG: FAD-dependent oxidoreductase [Brevefilum sp.]|nr:FAD-dependent oxidoreductase [Brevefilum sp.]
MNYLVAVIGAGPAGLYAAQYLARQGVQVVLFNRDIKPGGLAEYGIFPDKHKMRTGLMAQFKRIIRMPSVRYLGNVTVGQSGQIKFDQLRRAGFQAIMVTTGAQENNWLGLPGEDLDGVYHANDIVFQYNQLPERVDQQFDFGNEIAVIGVGNVMLDIVHYLKRDQHPGEMTAYARRGPGAVKFDTQTLEPVAGCLDLTAIKSAVDEAAPTLKSVGEDATDFFLMLAEAREKSQDCASGMTFRMRFLRSPRRLIGDEIGRVRAIEFEINELVQKDGFILARGTGQYETVSADTIIFSIGSQVDPGLGLPVAQGNYLTSPEPRFPIDGISYEVYNPDLCVNCDDIFVCGWARLASEGIVGLARKDAERGARAILDYLETLMSKPQTEIEDALGRLPEIDKRMVDLPDLEILWALENKIALEKGLPEFKFSSNEAMLEAIEKESIRKY